MDLLNSFISKKKAESTFVSLLDGESAVITKLKDIKMVTKTGFGGEEKEVLRLKCEVQTQEGLRDKDFDNGTQRFAQELADKGVTVGCGFTLTRTGTTTKTRYTISNVVGGTPAVVAPVAAPAVPEAAPEEGEE